jgi:hypothetical protein
MFTFFIDLNSNLHCALKFEHVFLENLKRENGQKSPLSWYVLHSYFWLQCYLSKFSGCSVMSSSLSCSINFSELTFTFYSDSDSIREYINRGASSVVLSDAIFNKEAISQNNFKEIYQLARSAALQGNDAVEQ